MVRFRNFHFNCSAIKHSPTGSPQNTKEQRIHKRSTAAPALSSMITLACFDFSVLFTIFLYPINVHFLPYYLVSGEKPTLPQLFTIGLPSRVGQRFQVFGTLLLQDEYGNKMENITENCRGRPEMITMEVLREWLAGKGVEVSWDSLISTLTQSELPLMARQIQMALDKLRS